MNIVNKFPVFIEIKLLLNVTLLYKSLYWQWYACIRTAKQKNDEDKPPTKRLICNKNITFFKGIV